MNRFSETHKHGRNFAVNLAIIGIGLFAGALLSRIDIFHTFLLNLGSFRYLGVFIGGMLFVSTFTVATGSVILVYLAQTMAPIEIALLAAAGAVISNLTIFHFVQDDLVDEIACLYRHFGGNHLHHVLCSRYVHWLLPVVGALIIASPIPDEIGISLLGLSHMSTRKFIVLSFLLNSIGMFSVALLSTRVHV